MEAPNTGVQIGIMFLFVVLSAFFSSTETAFTSANRIRLKNMATDGNKRAALALELIERYDELLSTTLIGNNIANIGNTAVATVFFVRLYGVYGPTVSTIVMTIIVLIFGEVTPKVLAKEKAEFFAMAFAPVINTLRILFTPFNFLFSQWRKFLLKVLKVDEDKGITEDELLTIVEEAETEGNIQQDHSELIQNAIEFDELEAWDVLTPRVDIEAIDIEMTEDEVAEMFLETGFSRLPVYEDDLDTILGVLSQKDFHNYIFHKDKTISDYIKPIVYVAGTMKAFALLQKMQHDQCQIAIIVDEYGGTLGLVTMEDIIEELVGEIYDEHEEVESQDITPLQNGSYRVLGTANVEKVFEFFGEDEDFDDNTVNGLVMRLLDKLPEPGDTFEYESQHKIFRGKVIKTEDRIAVEINMTVEDKPEDED